MSWHGSFSTYRRMPRDGAGAWEGHLVDGEEEDEEEEDGTSSSGFAYLQTHFSILCLMIQMSFTFQSRSNAFEETRFEWDFEAKMPIFALY